MEIIVMPNRDYDDAIRDCLAQYNLYPEFQHGGKHRYTIVDYAGKRHKIIFAATPGDFRATQNIVHYIENRLGTPPNQISIKPKRSLIDMTDELNAFASTTEESFNPPRIVHADLKPEAKQYNTFCVRYKTAHNNQFRIFIPQELGKKYLYHQFTLSINDSELFVLHPTNQGRMFKEKSDRFGFFQITFSNVSEIPEPFGVSPAQLTEDAGEILVYCPQETRKAIDQEHSERVAKGRNRLLQRLQATKPVEKPEPTVTLTQDKTSTITAPLPDILTPATPKADTVAQTQDTNMQSVSTAPTAKWFADKRREGRDLQRRLNEFVADGLYYLAKVNGQYKFRVVDIDADDEE
jgi:hypothetical protein